MSYGTTTAAVFRAISDETRREILVAIADQPLPVHVLAERFDVSRPAISKHLRVLGEAGLVRCSRSGKENLYRVDPGPLAGVADWLSRFWVGRLQLLKDLAERKQ